MSDSHSEGMCASTPVNQLSMSLYSEYNCQSDTCIHLVRRVDVSILDEVITEERLKVRSKVDIVMHRFDVIH